MTCTALPLEIHKMVTTCPTQSHIPEEPNRQQFAVTTRNPKTYTCIRSIQCKAPHVYWRCSKTAQDICNIYLTTAQRRSTLSLSAAVTHVKVSHRDCSTKADKFWQIDVKRKVRWLLYIYMCGLALHFIHTAYQMATISRNTEIDSDNFLLSNN